MSLKKRDDRRDVDRCKDEILEILYLYNCELRDFDEGQWILLCDKDTQETVGMGRNRHE